MKFTLAITTYNRDILTLDSFCQVLNDSRVNEVIIVDDCSDGKYFDRIVHLLTTYDSLKIKLHRNESNLGMMLNKRRAVECSSNEWVILFDSDNIITSQYLDAIPKDLDPNVIYCPSFARPHFDYRKFSGKMINIPEAKKMMADRMGNACFNTCNYLVHRDTYLKVFQPDPNVRATDTISFNYQWLKSGRQFFVVPGMEYDHRVHDGSGFMADADFNMRKAEEYKQKILAL